MFRSSLAMMRYNFSIIRLAHRNTQLLHFEGASVLDGISFGLGLGLHPGRPKLSVHRKWKVVHFVSRRQSDFEAVSV